MRTAMIRSALLLTGVTLWGCSGSVLPSAPSTLTPLAAPGTGGARIRLLDDPATPAQVTPMSVIINIIGTFGFNAFDPNPIQATLGDMIVWTNNDTRVHHIVFDDGTDVGEVAPGQASAPVALTTQAASFHCTIHPSMVGSIGDLSASPTPEPPTYYPPPPEDYYGYY